MIKPCIEPGCGEPSASSRCPEHRREHRSRQRGSARSRGYDTTWDKLSRRARALQPFCSDCHGTDDLTTDHLPSAWQRKADGKPIRLADVDVVCGPCNTRRGSSRPSATYAGGGGEGGSPPLNIWVKIFIALVLSNK